MYSGKEFDGMLGCGAVVLLLIGAVVASLIWWLVN